MWPKLCVLLVHCCAFSTKCSLGRVDNQYGCACTISNAEGAWPDHATASIKRSGLSFHELRGVWFGNAKVREGRSDRVIAILYIVNIDSRGEKLVSSVFPGCRQNIGLPVGMIKGSFDYQW